MAGADKTSVVMCQIGAREHYGVARALHKLGVLDHLVTDFWCHPGQMSRLLPLSMQGRWHEELRDAPVHAFNSQSMIFEARARTLSHGSWEEIMRRNRWFQDLTVRWLEKHLQTWQGAPRVVASYSYAASRVFFTAKRMGCRAVMFQIDPGPAEEEILINIEKKYPALIKESVVAPREYWSDWKLQCELADRIVVNSEWSRSCLIRADVLPEKIRVIPLAYEGPATDAGAKKYPVAFTNERPLQVLFLGLVNLRKGTGEILDALEMLKDLPIEVTFVGPVLIKIPSRARQDARLKWTGQVPRQHINQFYRAADVFLFPTISDGFGLTQLEAQACGLPIIASKFCGEVVQDGHNGLTLQEVSAAEIARCLRWCASHPAELQLFSNHSRLREQYLFPSLMSACHSVLEELSETQH